MSLDRAGPAFLREVERRSHIAPKRILSSFEFWPAALFYAPVVLCWFWQAIRHRSLTLPTIANPAMECGGLCGESKIRQFTAMGGGLREIFAPFVSLPRGAESAWAEDRATLLALMEAAGLDFPVVAKPDIGCQGAGVQLVRDRAQLDAYLKAFPSGARLLLQRLIRGAGEVGVFYVRRPGEATGCILSMTLKLVPTVIGDGTSTLEQLIRRDPRAGRLTRLYLPRHRERLSWIVPAGEPVSLTFAGNHCKGAIFRDGAELITPALTARIDEIARSIPDFHFGRFDIRYATLAGLRRGTGLTILEFNGGGSEATHIWDADMTLTEAYRVLFTQIRLLFEIGALNRNLGHVPSPAARLIGAWRREKRLMGRYPATH